MPSLENFQPININANEYLKYVNAVGEGVNSQIDRFTQLHNQAVMNNLMSKNTDSSGNINQQGLIQGMAENGLGSEAPSMIEKLQALATNKINQKSAEYESLQRKIGLIGQVMGGVLESATPLIAYNAAKKQLSEYGFDMTAYPNATSDAAAKEAAKTAYNSSLTAQQQAMAEYHSGNLEVRETEAGIKRDSENRKSYESPIKMTNDTNKANAYVKSVEQTGLKNQMDHDPNVNFTDSQSKALGQASGKGLAEVAELRQKAESFKREVNNQVDHIIQLIKASTDTLVGKLAGKALALGGKEYKPQTALSELQQIKARWLQAVPFPPGSQSDKEQAARENTLAKIDNPDISSEERINTFRAYVRILNDTPLPEAADYQGSSQGTSEGGSGRPAGGFKFTKPSDKGKNVPAASQPKTEQGLPDDFKKGWGM